MKAWGNPGCTSPGVSSKRVEQAPARDQTSLRALALYLCNRSFDMAHLSAIAVRN